MLEVSKAKLSLGGKPLFDHLSFTLERGKLLCIGGASGCGKSSLLRAIIGLIPLDEGDVFIDNKRLCQQDIHAIRSKTSYLSQDLSFPNQPVSQMVKTLTLLKANKHLGITRKDMLEQWMRLGLEEELLGHFTNEISGGQRQRIMLAMSGMLNKPLLIVDEPTSALDEQSTGKTIEYLKYLAQKGTAILCVSHDQRLLDAADQLIMLKNTENPAAIIEPHHQ